MHKYFDWEKLTLIFIGVCIISSLGRINAQSIVTPRLDIKEQTGNVLLPSPVASEFAKYVTNPIGYYTGIPEISIPVWNIKLRDFILPISVNYHAGGVKVGEAASNLGLGWSLMAGGVITRVVKDKPDDHYQGCGDSWLNSQTTSPIIEGFTYCGNGLLWAKSAAPNANYDGITDYNIDLSQYNGPPGSSSYSLNLLKKFYGIAFDYDNNSKIDDMYMLSMADKEPDIFYFNFAGKTGKFVFDVSGEIPSIKIIPYQDLLIEYTTTNRKLTEFKVTDEAGIIYFFREIEKTEVNTRASLAPLDYGDSESNGLLYEVRNYETSSGKKSYNSSWYLSRIETPLGEYVDLAYEDEEYRIENRGPQQTGLYYIKPPQGAQAYNPNDITNYAYYNALSSNETSVTGKRISSIQNNNVLVTFEGVDIRQDLVYVERTTPPIPGVEPTILSKPPYAINDITIFNKIGSTNRVGKFKLSYDYFVSPSTEVINYDAGQFTDWLAITVRDPDKYYKRLRLRSIQEYGVDDNTNNPPYQFIYRYFDLDGSTSDKLPHRLSFQQDVYGYFNGASGNRTLIPQLWIYPTNYPLKDNRQFSVFNKSGFSGAEYPLPGANRTVNQNTIGIGMLTKIVYPTGGSTSYLYESNSFLDDDGNNQFGGGVRIKRITKNDGISSEKDIVYNYEYTTISGSQSSGAIITQPIFAMRNLNLPISGIPNDNSAIAYQSYTTRYSTPQATIGTTNGSYVGYRRVVELIEGNGKTEYKYSMPATWNINNDVQGDGCFEAIDGFCDGLYQTTPVKDIIVSREGDDLNLGLYDFSQTPALPNTFPFPDNPNYDWQRGHLLSESVYNEEGGRVLIKNYEYENYFPAGKTSPTKIYGYKISHHYPSLTSGYYPSAYLFRISKYSIIADVAKVLKSNEEIRYGIDANISTKTEYEFNNQQHPIFSDVITTNSDGNEYKTTSKFPTDLSGSELGSNLLRDKHINNRLLRQSKFVNGAELERYETNYGFDDGHIVPLVELIYPRANSEVITSNFDFDEKGNMIESRSSNSTTTNFLWGYNKQYPVAKVEGSSIAEIRMAFGGQIPDFLNGGMSSSQESVLRGWFNLNNPHVQITTFTYQPMQGILSITNPDGIRGTFEYDRMNRLHLIRDKDDNILKMYKYIFKQ